MPGGGPVAMTVEQRAYNAAAQHAFKRLVFLTRLPLGDNFIAIRKAAHVQTLRIRRSTTKAREIRRVSFLNALHHLPFLATDTRKIDADHIRVNPCASVAKPFRAIVGAT